GRLEDVILAWQQQHSLAQLLQQLCRREQAQTPETGGNFVAAVTSDQRLARWVENVVAEDWHAYLAAAEPLSADEQLDMMTGLIGLHTHVALLHRLMDSDSLTAKPAFFIAATKKRDDDRACDRAAYNRFSLWRDQAEPAMRRVARDIIQGAVEQDRARKDSRLAGHRTAPEA